MPQKHSPKNGQFIGSSSGHGARSAPVHNGKGHSASNSKTAAAMAAHAAKQGLPASVTRGKGGHVIPDYMTGYGPGKK